MGNMPTMGVDPDGEFWHIVIGAAIGAIVNYTVHGLSTGNWFDQGALQAFGTGAVIGAAVAATGGAASAAATPGMTAAASFEAGFASVQLSAGAVAVGGTVGGAVSGGLTTLSNNNLFDGNWNTSKDVFTEMGKGALRGLATSVASTQTQSWFRNADGLGGSRGIFKDMTWGGEAWRKVAASSIVGSAEGLLNDPSHPLVGLKNGAINGAMSGTIDVAAASAVAFFQSIEIGAPIGNSKGAKSNYSGQRDFSQGRTIFGVSMDGGFKNNYFNLLNPYVPTRLPQLEGYYEFTREHLKWMLIPGYDRNKNKQSIYN